MITSQNHLVEKYLSIVTVSEVSKTNSMDLVLLYLMLALNRYLSIGQESKALTIHVSPILFLPASYVRT